MSAASRIGIGAASGVCVLVVIIAAAAGSVAALFPNSSSGPGGASGCTPVGATSAVVAGYQPVQVSNAAVIVAVGKRLGVPARGQVIAVAAALQESSLINLDHGDRDSLGLFQQRPSQGWGTPAQIMNPAYAATAFYQHLLAIGDWARLSVNDAAQAVQRSATPQAYGPHEATARQIVAALADAVCAPASTPTSPGGGGGGCATVQAPDPAVLAAVDYACAQLGLPYTWDGSGPAAGDAGFDCSGLTQAAYAAAGIALPHNAAAQYAATAHVPPGQPLQPGDLVFFGTSPATIHHVGLYVGAGLMIDAPDVGLKVRVEPAAEPDYYAAARPAATSR